MKKIIKMLLGLVLVVSIAMLAGCDKATDGSQKNNSASSGVVSEATETPANAEVKPVILVVSFGTSYNDSREKTIGAIENRIEECFTDYEVRRAFTSQIIIDKLKERDNIEIDNVEQALNRLVNDGVKNLIVQPTHLMSGYEYDDLASAVEEYNDKFDSVSFGLPLLSSDEDLREVSSILADVTKDYNTEGTAIVFMGHGTEHEANEVYTKLQEEMTNVCGDNYFIGTVEASPTLDDVVAAVKAGGYTKVVLQPLMVVAGDHANNDMAGDDDDSWKSVFENEGFEVECVLSGLGEFSLIQDIYVQHVESAEQQK